MTEGQDHSFDGLDVLAFLAEFVLWAACAVAAFHVAGGGVAGGIAAAVTVVVVIVGWSLVMAPRSVRRLPVTGRNLVVLALGALAATVLVVEGARAWALAAAVSAGLMIVADRWRRTTRVDRRLRR